MKNQKYVILTVALVVGIFGISLSVPRNGANKTSTQASSYTPRTSTYYIVAEDTTWNYTPTGKDQMTGKQVPEPWGKQLAYKKVRYFEYTDDSFTEKNLSLARWVSSARSSAASKATRLRSCSTTKPASRIVYIPTACTMTKTMKAQRMKPAARVTI
jgi:hypothetical protein